jgi:hypothetical protein
MCAKSTGTTDIAGEGRVPATLVVGTHLSVPKNMVVPIACASRVPANRGKLGRDMAGIGARQVDMTAIHCGSSGKTGTSPAMADPTAAVRQGASTNGSKYAVPAQFWSISKKRPRRWHRYNQVRRCIARNRPALLPSFR